MANFVDMVKIVVVKGVAFVNGGNDIDGQDVDRVIRNLVANASAKVKIAVHTKPVGKTVTRVSGKELLALCEEHTPMLRTSYKALPNGRSFPTPYLSFESESTAVKATNTKRPTSSAKLVD